jgi:hypothetical protein
MVKVNVPDSAIVESCGAIVIRALLGEMPWPNVIDAEMICSMPG